MAKKASIKPKRTVYGIPFGPDNPPPKSPGRPRKKPAEPILEEGIPEKLAWIRAASRWIADELPQHPDVRFWIEFRRKSIREFQQVRERLEKEFEESQKPAVEPAAVDESSEPEEVDDPSGRRVVEEIGVWLARCKQEAEERAKEYES